MQNQYYTNRHYEETNNIQKSVCKMNSDIRELSNYCDMLEQQLHQKENIIKEVREYIENNKEKQYGFNYEYELNENGIKELLQILDKENKE